MDRPLAGRTAVVTGAGRGIGRATALTLAELGAAVVNDLGTSTAWARMRVRPRRSRSRSKRRGATTACVASVTDFAAVERMMAEAVARFGGLDILLPLFGATATGQPQVTTMRQCAPAQARRPPRRGADARSQTNWKTRLRESFEHSSVALFGERADLPVLADADPSVFRTSCATA